MAATNNRVIPSIIIATGALYAFHLTLFRLVLPRPAVDEAWRSFLLSTTLLHLLLLAFLLWRRGDFVLLPSQYPVRRINLSNLLSTFRITSAVSILFYLILIRDYPTLPVLLVMTTAAFLSDLFDGIVSRRFNQVTRIGRYLDSISDYTILLVVCVAIHRFGLISDWFFALLMVRFVGQGVGITALLLYAGRVDIGATFLGKASVFGTMVTLGVSLLQLLPAAGEALATAVGYIEYLAAVTLVVSLLEKALLLLRGFRESRRQRPPV